MSQRPPQSPKRNEGGFVDVYYSVAAMHAPKTNGRNGAPCGLSDNIAKPVYFIAKSYTEPREPLSAHIQAERRGLMQAAERFAPAKGFRLSPFATHFVRRAVARTIYEDEGDAR